MKKLIFVFVFLACFCQRALGMGFVECDKIYVADTAAKQGTVVFVNTFYPEYRLNGNDVWSTIDVSNYIPPGTKSIFLQGILIITYDTGVGIADMHIHAKKHGETYIPPYNGQVVEAKKGNGIRSDFASWVPVDENGKFDFKYWCREIEGVYYGINLSIQAYVK